MTHRDLKRQVETDAVLFYLLEAIVTEIILSDLEALVNGSATYAGSAPCVIGRAIKDIPEPYKSKLTELVMTRWADGGYTDDEVAARMKAAGLRSSSTSVRRHRNGHCSCL